MSEAHDPRQLPLVSFHCSRCGACCNSAPQLSVPELFHHQRRFVGCLTVRRVERLRPGSRWGGAALVTEADGTAFDAFVPSYLHTARGRERPELVWLAAQAYDEPGLGRCPALGADNLCTVQNDNKPLGCRAVPLEPLLPDALQLQILTQRASEAAYMGANCLSLGTRSGVPLLATQNEVVDTDARRALDERRQALALERRLWGDTVFEILRNEMFDHPERMANLPAGGYLSLSLAPALAVISAASHPVRQRVVEYLSAQIELLAAILAGSAPLRPSSERTLQGFVRANVALREKLQEASTDRRASSGAREVETWLGLHGAAPTSPPAEHPSP